MIHSLLGLAFLCALANWYSVWQKDKKIEAVTKLLTMVLLMSWVFVFGWQESFLGTKLIYFLIGLGLCLIGDIFLFMPPEKYFFPGLAFFLLGQMSYIVGFGGFGNFSKYIIPFLIYLIVIVAAGFKIVGRLVAGLRNQNKERLILPVVFYAVVISGMLGSAGYRFFDENWSTLGAYLVAGGALLFYISDVLNAWERFVGKFKNDRLIIMSTYHLGQFFLSVGAALHFAGKLPG